MVAHKQDGTRRACGAAARSVWRRDLEKEGAPGHRGKPFLERDAGGGVASAWDRGAHSEGQRAVGVQGPWALSRG